MSKRGFWRGWKAHECCTHDVTSIIFILLDAVVQPTKLLVLSHDTEVGLGEARQCGHGVHGELDPILFAQRVRNVHFLKKRRQQRGRRERETIRMNQRRRFLAAGRRLTRELLSTRGTLAVSGLLLSLSTGPSRSILEPPPPSGVCTSFIGLPVSSVPS